ncbi:glucose/arabinose dehydrogenase [Filimonas zeae]|uniref:Sorbosone dehydrogenase n=1 Tax=Filimonas zeae TaxID=1737353 RepID=A0A917IY29_9BACT|nr:sorbosone dehydrogenase family protein [Filimonas zeae]MDR6338564.1 glucose/arabinose dehydrogenase [Filimonas zeae]GGH67646.1 sorbosone dehydrogenase [Filimonas zeae]
MKITVVTFCTALLFFSCQSGNNQQQNNADSAKADTVNTQTGQIDLPAPTESKNLFCKVTGWPDGVTPKAPSGFVVTKFAGDLNNPRWIYQASNGDIFVSQASTDANAIKKAAAKLTGKAKSQNLGNSANTVLLFRDTTNDGVPDVQEVFLSGLEQPFGMLVLGNNFYVANTNALLRYPYNPQTHKITGEGKKILDLPAGGYNNHWTRNIIANGNGSKIYISVGSGSNVAEHGIENEIRRANILEINPDGTGERIYASGLRNPVGMAWAPGTADLWTAVNERDELGDELVPDYATSVKDGGFYGWPYSYFGQHKDARMNNAREDLVAKAIVPDVPLGSHTASLGLAFYDKDGFPDKYKSGAFIGQHGSWNSSKLVGYKVVFVPFKNGKPSGKPEDFLTGFINAADGDHSVYGRPVGVTVLQNGAMMVADDASNTLWYIRKK